MCKAQEEQKNEGRELGREEGRKEGREEGRIRQAKVTALKLQKKVTQQKIQLNVWILMRKL